MMKSRFRTWGIILKASVLIKPFNGTFKTYSSVVCKKFTKSCRSPLFLAHFRHTQEETGCISVVSLCGQPQLTLLCSLAQSVYSPSSSLANVGPFIETEHTAIFFVWFCSLISSSSRIIHIIAYTKSPPLFMDVWHPV